MAATATETAFVAAAAAMVGAAQENFPKRERKKSFGSTRKKNRSQKNVTRGQLYVTVLKSYIS
jgi:hypothetical protein